MSSEKKQMTVADAIEVLKRAEKLYGSDLPIIINVADREDNFSYNDEYPCYDILSDDNGVTFYNW